MDPVPLVAVEQEWRLLARGRLAVEFRRWQSTEPALRAFGGPERLPAFLWNDGADLAVKDRLLAALLRLARSEPVASRVVSQAMLPGLKTLAGRLLRRSPDGKRVPVLERGHAAGIELQAEPSVAVVERARRALRW